MTGVTRLKKDLPILHLWPILLQVLQAQTLSQVSDKFKTGVGYDSQVFDSQVFDSQMNDKYKSSEGYHAVPPPYTRNFMPPKPDLVLADKDEYVFSESVTSVLAIATSKVKTKFKSRQRKPSNSKVKFVKSNEHVKSPRESVKKYEKKMVEKHVWNNARNTMSTYLKNMAGYKNNQLKTKSFEDIQMLFDKEMKKIVPDDVVAIDAIPLATKPPIIVDWKIIKEGKMGYFQIIRADGSSKRNSSMIQMLLNIDREDLETLWKLIKAKHGLKRLEEGYERVLWGDLKVMFEPDVESKVWRNLQGHKVIV
ncbi:hypothetical protein Tco_0809168 [Tanacetum coccineum]